MVIVIAGESQQNNDNLNKRRFATLAQQLILCLLKCQVTMYSKQKRKWVQKYKFLSKGVVCPVHLSTYGSY